MGSAIAAFSESIVNFNGGTVFLENSAFEAPTRRARAFAARSGSTVNIHGGNLEFSTFGFETSAFVAESESQVNITGGNLDFRSDRSRFVASSGSVVNMSGGDLRDSKWLLRLFPTSRSASALASRRGALSISAEGRLTELLKLPTAAQ